jgi:hypothetical protein
LIISAIVIIILIKILTDAKKEKRLLCEEFNERFGTLISDQSTANSVSIYWKIINLFRWLLTMAIFIVLRTEPGT